MILVLNGPNLNLLGTREPQVYGSLTLAELDGACRRWGTELGLAVDCRQSNHEGQLIDWLHGAKEEGFRGVVINAGGYSHTSVALRDAIAAIPMPVVEVHLSNLLAREEFRHTSLLTAVCRGSIAGLGAVSYKAALVSLGELLAAQPH